MPVQPVLFLGEGRQLPLHALHPGDHRVQRLQYILLGDAPVDAVGGGLLECLFHEASIFLNLEAGGSEILAEEFDGKLEEGLILEISKPSVLELGAQSLGDDCWAGTEQGREGSGPHK